MVFSDIPRFLRLSINLSDRGDEDCFESSKSALPAVAASPSLATASNDSLEIWPDVASSSASTSEFEIGPCSFAAASSDTVISWPKSFKTEP